MCFTRSSVGAEKGRRKRGSGRLTGTGSAQILKQKTANLYCFSSTSLKVSNCWSAATTGAFITCFVIYRSGKAVEHHPKYFGKGRRSCWAFHCCMQTACFVPWQRLNGIYPPSHSYGFKNPTRRFRQRSDHTIN